jgi:hypothetical protein
MTYAELQAALLAQIGRAPSAICYQMVTDDLNRTLFIRSTLKVIELTAEEEVPLPPDLGMIHDVFLDNREIRPAPMTQRNANYAESGDVQTYSLTKGFMVLNPVGSGDVKIRYYPKLSALSADSDTNAVLTSHSSVYIFGVLYFHEALIKNVQAAMAYRAIYDDAKKSVQGYEVASDAAGSPMIPTVRSAP